MFTNQTNFFSSSNYCVLNPSKFVFRDEVDGLKQVSHGLTSATSTILASLKVAPLHCIEREVKSKELGRENMNLKVKVVALFTVCILSS
jgi:hypothetical protein